MSDTSNAPSTASGKALLDDYYQPDTGWVDAWDGGGLEARIRAIEDEAKAAFDRRVARTRRDYVDPYLEQHKEKEEKPA